MDRYCVEYSPIQGAFNIEKFSVSLTNNFKQCVGYSDFTGYLIIFTGTFKDCKEYVNQIEPMFETWVGRE